MQLALDLDAGTSPLFLTDVIYAGNTVQLRTGATVDIWRQSPKHDGRRYVWIHYSNATYFGIYPRGWTVTVFKRLKGKGYNR